MGRGGEGRNSRSAGGGGLSHIKVKYRFYTGEPFNNFNERSSAPGLLKEVIGDYSQRARSLTSNPRYF